MEIEKLYELYQKFPKISTDSRKIEPDSIFFALKGDNFNGNIFALQALEVGATFAVVDEKKYAVNDKILYVENALKELQNLAKMHRDHLQCPVIGLTGSNGKTTTKELIYAVLSQKYKTFATKGNLNNHIGVPLTLLATPVESEMLIVEMGANHQKEIEFLCGICKPDYGLITNIGKAHLEGFGGEEGVRKGKKELFDFIAKTKGKVFYNSDDPILLDLAQELDGMTYGRNSKADIGGEIKNVEPFIQFQWENTEYSSAAVQSRLVGSYNFYNLLAAVSIGNFFAVKPEDINTAIENYTPSNNRSQFVETEYNKVILDAYNANPSSMLAAIQNFTVLNENNKLIILGDMLELGSSSDKEHQTIIKLLQDNKLEAWLVGPNFSQTKNEFKSFIDHQEAIKELLLHPIRNKYILIKGSRAIKLETLLPQL